MTENVSAYTLTLTSSNLNPIQNTDVTFTAALDLDGTPAGAGNIIQFYQGSTLLATNLTDANGIAVLTWNMTNVGAIDFKAGFGVP